jgi:Tfp pilus assembly protein PilX
MMANTDCTKLCARDEQGFVLVTAIVLLTVMMGLGFGLLMYGNSQQHAAGYEQASETAFDLAEAALNAQISQLAHKWPGTEELAKEYPASGCTAITSTATNGCPSTGSLSAGYPSIGSGTCPAGTGTDAWGSSGNGWTTYVRDDKYSSTYFNSAEEKKEPTWDENKDGDLWVRSVGIVQCHVVTLVSLVSKQNIPFNFPRNAATANWFETTNNGNKTIINTQGKAAEPGNVSMRCAGFKGTEEEVDKACKKYISEKSRDQVSPDTTNSPGSPSPTLSAAQLEALKQQAESDGTYYASGSCPNNEKELAGLPVYVEGPCNISMGGNAVINSEASPGFLVIINGTIAIGGTCEFYGVIYDTNQQEANGVVAELFGKAHVVGAIDVDGSGGINFGSSKVNLEFNPKVIEEFKLYSGVSSTRNSFRVLPAGQ